MFAKTLYISAFIAATLTGSLCFGDIVYTFDDDTPGSTPPEPWVVSGSQTPTITDSAAYSGSQSLQTAHGVGWNRADYPINIAPDDPASFSVMVNPSNQGYTEVSLMGVYSPLYKQASVNFKWNIDWVGMNSYQYIYIDLYADQTHSSVSHTISYASSDGQVVQWPNQWYEVSFSLTSSEVTMSVVGDGVDITRTASRTDSEATNLQYLRLTGQSIGSFRDPRFDDVSIGLPVDCTARAARGDFNCDANVDLSDLVTLGENYNTTGLELAISYTLGDTNADGNVDLADLVTLGENYNTTITPEPAAFSILTITAGATLIRRRSI